MMMVRLSFHGRRGLRQRVRGAFTAGLCTASFLTSHWLFGQDGSSRFAAQPTLPSPYLQAKNGLESDSPAAKKQQPDTSASESGASGGASMSSATSSRRGYRADTK